MNHEAQFFLAFIVLIITDRIFLMEECLTVMFLSFRLCLFPCVYKFKIYCKMFCSSRAGYKVFASM